MNLSAPFIARPVATTLLTIGIALAGLVAFLKLPVAPLPQGRFPNSRSQPAARRVARDRGTKPDHAVGAGARRNRGVTEITSMRTVGNARITLQFDLSRSSTGAARDVQAAINAARMEMPSDLPTNRSTARSTGRAPAVVLAVTSDIIGQGRLFDAARPTSCSRS